MSTIYVVGARGLMGKRVLALLQEKLPPEKVVALSRREPKSDPRHVDLRAPEALHLQQGDVVVNAVGLHPLDLDPGPMITHCLQAGAHYVDLSESRDIHELGEDAFTAFTAEHPATSAVVQGCSTIPAMVDVLMPASPGTDRTVLLSVGMRNELGVSLMYGLLRPLGRKHQSGRWWTTTTTRQLFDGSRRRYGSHPGSWTDGHTHFSCGLDRRFAYWALRAASRLTRHMSNERLEAFCRATLPIASAGGYFVGTPRGSLRLEQRRSGQVTGVVEVRAERNGLIIPSLPAVWAALELVSRTDLSGLIELGELFDKEATVADLRDRGYTVELVSDLT